MMYGCYTPIQPFILYHCKCSRLIYIRNRFNLKTNLTNNSCSCASPVRHLTFIGSCTYFSRPPAKIHLKLSSAVARSNWKHIYSLKKSLFSNGNTRATGIMCLSTAPNIFFTPAILYILSINYVIILILFNFLKSFPNLSGVHGRKRSGIHSQLPALGEQRVHSNPQHQFHGLWYNIKQGASVTWSMFLYARLYSRYFRLYSHVIGASLCLFRKTNCHRVSFGLFIRQE